MPDLSILLSDYNQKIVDCDKMIILLLKEKQSLCVDSRYDIEATRIETEIQKTNVSRVAYLQIWKDLEDLAYSSNKPNLKFQHEMKQVIVLRKDLKMRKGKMIAQGAHASMRVIVNYTTNETHKRYIKEWLDNSFTKIAVSVDSLLDLDIVYKNALTAGLPCSIITDNGKTEFNGVKTKTAVAVGPGPVELIDTITGNLKLL